MSCTHEFKEGHVVTVINAGGIAGGCSLCREDRLRRWYAELHYAVRKDANILDHKLTEQEAHDRAVARVERMHAELEAFHRLATTTKVPRAMKCPGCDQPMLPAGEVKRPNEYDHASGCPRAPFWVIKGEDDYYLVGTSRPDSHGYMRAATTCERRDEALHFYTREAALRVMASQPTGRVVKCMPKAARSGGSAP